MRLPARELVELDRPAQAELAAELLPPDLADGIGVPDEVGLRQRRDEISGHGSELAVVEQRLVDQVQSAFDRRVDDCFFQRAEGPLGEGGERSERLDLVTEELHANRLASGRREHVHDAAANGELASLLGPLDALVAREREQRDELVRTRLVARPEADRLGTRLGGRQALGDTGTLADEVRRRHEAALPANPARGEQPDALLAEEPARCLGRVTRVGIVGQNAHQRRSGAARKVERGEEERQERLRDARGAGLGRERAEPIALGELPGEDVERGWVHDQRRNRGFRGMQS